MRSATGNRQPATGTVGEVLAEMRTLIGSQADEIYAAVVGGSTSMAWLEREKPITSFVRCRLLQAAERCAAGWPQQYATGRANFRGHWLSVDHRVLIPRPETEGLVDLVIDRLPVAGSRLPVVCDVGTGSGAIAIALALEARVAGVVALDVSAEALNVAIENAAALGVKERISFRRGDCLNGLLGEKVDAIVSNPPYIATAEWERLEAGVREYEPRLALDGGRDGLDVARRLVAQSGASLEPGGLLALEADERRADETAALLVAAGFTAVEVNHDLSGRPRYVHGRQPENA